MKALCFGPDKICAACLWNKMKKTDYPDLFVACHKVHRVAGGKCPECKGGYSSKKAIKGALQVSLMLTAKGAK